MKLTRDELSVLWCALDRWEMLLRRERLKCPDKRAEYDRRIRAAHNIKRRIDALCLRSGARDFRVIER